MSDVTINYVTQGVEQAAQQIEKTNRAIEKTGTSAKTGISSLVGLGASASALYFQFDNLDKVQLRIQKNQRLMEEQQLKLNKMQKEGKTNTEEYRLELRQLQEMQERLRQSQQDLTQAQAGFAFNLAGVALQIPTAISATHGLTAAINLNKLAFLAHPLGIVLIAATTAALAIYASNIGGVKDKIDAWTSSLLENVVASKKANAEVGDLSKSLKPTLADSLRTSNEGLRSFTSNINTNTKAVQSNKDVIELWSNAHARMVAELKKNEIELAMRNLAARLGVLQDLPVSSNLSSGTLGRIMTLQDAWNIHIKGIQQLKQGARNEALELEKEIQRGINLENAFQRGRFKQITSGSFPSADPSGIIERRSLERITPRSTKNRVGGRSSPGRGAPSLTQRLAETSEQNREGLAKWAYNVLYGKYGGPEIALSDPFIYGAIQRVANLTNEITVRSSRGVAVERIFAYDAARFQQLISSEAIRREREIIDRENAIIESELARERLRIQQEMERIGTEGALRLLEELQRREGMSSGVVN